jgi:hypothetical protein
MIISLFLCPVHFISSWSIYTIVSEFEKMPGLRRIVHIAGYSQSCSRIEHGKDGACAKICVRLNTLKILTYFDGF